jgi:hypothetical protein
MYKSLTNYFDVNKGDSLRQDFAIYGQIKKIKKIKKTFRFLCHFFFLHRIYKYTFHFVVLSSTLSSKDTKQKIRSKDISLRSSSFAARLEMEWKDFVLEVLTIVFNRKDKIEGKIRIERLSSLFILLK